MIESLVTETGVRVGTDQDRSVSISEGRSEGG